LFSGADFDHNNLNIGFYQGYQILSISKDSTNEIVGNNSSLLNYPILEIFYFSSKHSPTFYRFFLMKQKSEIEINYDALSDDIMVKKKSGVFSFENAGQDKYVIYAKNEMAKRDEYAQKYNYDFVDTTVLMQFEIYSKAVKDKSLAFAKNNPTLLYSIWLFMNEIIGDPGYSKEHLNLIYNNYFKHKYKNTFEGKYILNKLNENRLGINTMAPFQKLAFEDLSGNTHSIKSFNGKPLLISVWATWCVPCVAEMPKLKELYTKYKDNLEILSFSTDTDEIKLRNFVSVKKMDWINVYNRRDLCHIYGSDMGVPQVYLLDKNGVIIYSRSRMEDYDLIRLEKLIEKISNVK
jgi:thiol-disulfide isomerase/thioredoxin